MVLTNGMIRGLRQRLSLLACIVLLSGSAICAQQNQPVDGDPSIDKTTIQTLLKKINELEERVKQLETERKGRETTSCAPLVTSESKPLAKSTAPAADSTVAKGESISSKSSSSIPEAESAQADNVMAERMDLSKTLLRIRGFGDISLHGDSQKGDTTSFSLGQLDLFVSSDVSDKYKFLSEIVFEAGANNYYGAISGSENTFDVDVERYLLIYSRNDYLNISAGRGHTAIGYYNTAYHHSTWLQTTTGRPFLYDFEDQGGILPIHMVGVSASGLIPSGQLGLHYVAEVGNERGSRNPLTEEPVQNEIADTNHKAFNLALFMRPEAVRGFQTGFSVYRDVLAPANAPRIGETILAAHAVLIRPKYEWLTEVLLDRHAPIGSNIVFDTPGFYTQASKQFSIGRPYFRYQYVNAARNEPVFSDVSLRHGPSLGIRFDPSESVALKLQYDYTFLRNQPGVNALNLQVGFTF
jgi:hypothetical protein